ncbi:formate/nitrite transporter family protein [Ligilactobacillus equi]|uniref:Formate/nitrite family of transporter n=1 Tax=Ligilactobacillus equi DPC 6820 TaxID=1392007 RepID=V7HX06_9LACO|nr:formate/nitrite transporter family protein [Ligilactobacillus equi]ETA73815.1 formate/nitrite family of transporter [Ligilactobacillus equi DPC 6820]
MYQESIQAVKGAANKKLALLHNNPLGYFLLSCLAGMYIGFGILLSFTVSGQLQGIPATKLIMGLCFGVALSLVIIAGAELFTGNNFVLGVGLFTKQNKILDALYLWFVCWLGNLCGAVILALIFNACGLQVEGVAKALAAAAFMKTHLGIEALLAPGVLCNILVCLAVWSGFQTKNDAAKLIMVFWCLLAFFTTGFEHSVANMTVITAGLLAPMGQNITLGGFAYNLFWVSLGNMIGAIFFLALPYVLAAKKQK